MPAIPFERFPSAIDPVALWSHNVESNTPNIAGLYFYVVNREQYPIDIDIDLKNAVSLVRLGTNETINETGSLKIHLLPYELRSFRTSSGSSIAGVLTHVPEAQQKQVELELAYADQISAQLNGDFSSAVSADEITRFVICSIKHMNP
ncbi:MAG: hypothetical protein QM811_19005 [Pirellulales bacterium]